MPNPVMMILCTSASLSLGIQFQEVGARIFTKEETEINLPNILQVASNKTKIWSHG